MFQANATILEMWIKGFVNAGPPPFHCDIADLTTCFIINFRFSIKIYPVGDTAANVLKRIRHVLLEEMSIRERLKVR